MSDPWANSEDEMNSDDSEDFSSIAEYFEPQKFSELSKLEKRMYLNQKERYDKSRTELPGLVQPPSFMVLYSDKLKKRKAAAAKAAAKKARLAAQPKTNESKRHSTRIKDSAIVPKPIENNISDDGTADRDDSDVPDLEVKMYFTPSEWSKMSIIVKQHAQQALVDYQDAQRKGIPMSVPKFISRGNSEAASSSQSPNVDRESSGTTSFIQSLADRETASSSKGNNSSKFTRGFTKHPLPNVTKNMPSSSLIQKEDQSPFQLYNDLEQDNSFDFSETLANTEETSNVELPESDLRSAMEAVIKKAVPKIEASLLSDLQDVLVTKGVESIDDFGLIEAAWLDGHGLKEMQLKKIMVEFQKHGSEKENVPPAASAKKTKVKQKQVPLMRAAQVDPPTIASRPLLSSKVVDAGTMDLQINFSKFPDSLLKSLEKDETPTYNDRKRMVNILCQDIVDKYEEMRKANPSLKQKTPGREVYKKVVSALFKDHKNSFLDTLNDKVFKDGAWSLTDQIETCIENMKRPNTPRGERSVSASGNRRAACILSDKYSIPMTKKMQAEAETTRKSLVSAFRSPRERWDWPAIKAMIINTSSLGAQRALINSRTRDINFIIDKWPFFSELHGLLSHLDEITGISLKENFERYVDEDMDGLIGYLIAMSPKRIKLMKLQKEQSYGSGEHKRLLAAVMMLAIHWDEDIKCLVSQVEETTLPHEVEDLLSLPSTPHIVALGTSVFTAKKFLVFLDQKCLCANLNNALEALMCMCAAYLIFGVLYPTVLSNTLTYFERIVANLSDEDGLLKAQTHKGAPAVSSFTKVKKLQTSIDQFEKDLAGDD